jgi:hypothetical protein
MRKYLLLLGLWFMAICLLFPYTLYAEPNLEEQIYKYVSLVSIDAAHTPEEEAWRQNYENGLLAPIKAKTPEAIPILFKILEDSSTQQILIKRHEQQGRSFATFNILSRTMYTIPKLSTDTAVMDRLYRYIETMIINGKDYDDFSYAISGIAALGKDFTENGVKRLMRLRHDFVFMKYSLQNFDADESLKKVKALDSPENMRNHFIRVIDYQLQEIQKQNTKSIWGN